MAEHIVPVGARQRAVCPEQLAKPVLVVPLTQERQGRINGEKKSEGLLRLLAAYV